MLLNLTDLVLEGITAGCNFENCYNLNVFSAFCSQLVDTFLESNIDLNSADIFKETIKNICTSLEQQCLSGHSIEKEHIDKTIEVQIRI